MIRAIIIDDEMLAVEVIKHYLADHPGIEVIAVCHNGFDGYKAILQYKPDLIFLDVQMPKLSGFEMLELVDDPPAVIFTTAFDEYAIAAFEANALDYLLKPFSRDRFEKAVKKLSARISMPPVVMPGIGVETRLSRVAVTSAGCVRIIPVSDIFYLEAYDDYVKIITRDDVFLKKQTMAYFEKALPAGFVRVHRSFILNLQEVTRIETAGKDAHQAVLRNGSAISLSRNGYPALKQALGL